MPEWAEDLRLAAQGRGPGGHVLAIRPAGEDDLLAWFARAESGPRRGWTEDAFRSVLDDARGHVLVATAAGTLAGLVGVRLTGLAGEVGLAVRRGGREADVGGALLAAAVDRCRELGVRKVVLALHPADDRALAVGQQLGFRRERSDLRHLRCNEGELWEAVLLGLTFARPVVLVDGHLRRDTSHQGLVAVPEAQGVRRDELVA